MDIPSGLFTWGFQQIQTFEVSLRLFYKIPTKFCSQFNHQPMKLDMMELVRKYE